MAEPDFLSRPADRAKTMRLTATLMLVVMAAIFLTALQFEGAHPAWGYVLAFSEAAMVGGMADWFAVTALFRHPMGLPIPHTAIIPKNKDRIADTMAQFLRNNFLTPQVVARRVHDINAAEAAGRFLTSPDGGEERLRAGVASLFADFLQSLDQERLGGIVKSALRAQLEKLDVAPLLGQVLGTAIADNRHLPVMDAFIRWTSYTLEDNEGMVRQMVHDRAGKVLRWTGLDEKLASSIIDGLYRLLAEMAADSQHPLRHKVQEGLETLAHDLVHDGETQAKVERIKLELLANPAIGKWMDSMWERTRTGLINAARNPTNALSGAFAASMNQAGIALSSDRRLQYQVNRFFRRSLVGTVNRYGDQIVRLVSETVKRWDAETVTSRVEGAVGRDLQFIRINGTLVGGIVGLTIHLIASLI